MHGDALGRGFHRQSPVPVSEVDLSGPQRRLG